MAIHHAIICVKDLERGKRAYGWLMPRVGYGTQMNYGPFAGWFSPHGGFWIKQADAKFAGDAFHKDRVGLCELAFASKSREDVDALARELSEHDFRILDAPKEYPQYTAGYYAVFFTDADGIKLEYVYTPPR